MPYKKITWKEVVLAGVTNAFIFGFTSGISAAMRGSSISEALKINMVGAPLLTAGLGLFVGAEIDRRKNSHLENIFYTAAFQLSYTVASVFCVNRLGGNASYSNALTNLTLAIPLSIAICGCLNELADSINQRNTQANLPPANITPQPR